MSVVIRLGSLLMGCLFAATAAAQDNLTRARELYESAAYEEALVELGRLKTADPASSAAAIDRYRALCLMALSRGAEADEVIESIVISDPLYLPAATEAAPRVRAAFSAVRQRPLKKTWRPSNHLFALVTGSPLELVVHENDSRTWLADWLRLGDHNNIVQSRNRGFEKL